MKCQDIDWVHIYESDQTHTEPSVFFSLVARHHYGKRKKEKKNIFTHVGIYWYFKYS